MTSTPEQTPTDPKIAGPAAAMKAVVQDSYGSADALRIETVAVPEVGADGVLIQVRAASVHIGDWHLMMGQPYLMRVMGFGLRAPKARVRGTDVAGTVEAIGENVKVFQVGDEVFGSCDGAFAEHATARVSTLAAKPRNLTHDQAAAVPTSACTALKALRIGGVAAGQQVLVVGASGGVGLFAVQIAKSFGAEVTGVCSTTKVDLVRSVGADHVIDYTVEDVSTNGKRYDLILDMGGDRTLSQLRRSLTPRGTLVLVGGEGGGRWVGGAMTRSLRALVMSPFVRQNLRMMFATVNRDDLIVLSELVDAGKVLPLIDRTYRLDQAADAIRDLQAGQVRGKLVITS
jgi:NADPH:quinone reductase-like Zn-dependent oxidoreductase